MSLSNADTERDALVDAVDCQLVMDIYTVEADSMWSINGVHLFSRWGELDLQNEHP